MSSKGTLNKIRDLIKCSNYKRLGRCFESSRNKYFYDLGTGKVFQIEEEVKKILQLILCGDWKEAELCSENAIQEVYNAILEEEILQAPELKAYIGAQVYDLSSKLNNNRAQITLELTEKCNMRCKYCIYHDGNGGYREFGSNDMTFEIAKLAIDDLMKNSADEKSVFISFYGGEPLLKFELIKRCVNYCEKIKNKNISYAITTNGTLINEEVATFFAELGDRIHITVSLDGPKYMNDKYRVYANDKGTFDDVVRGIKLLVKRFKEAGKGISLGINSVLSEYEQDDLNNIELFFKSQDWIPKETVYTSSFVSTKDREMDYLGVDSEVETELIENSRKIKGYFDPLFDWAKDDKGKDVTSKLIAKDNMIKELAMIHRRLLFRHPTKYYYMCGCCVPGARRIYVTTRGDYLICEKLGEAPSIGNVYKGLDIEKIKRIYVDDYCEKTIEFCNDCWAVHLCGMCYMNCYDKDGINLKLRHSKCIMNRIYIEKNLELYHELLESNSQVISVLNDYDFS